MKKFIKWIGIIIWLSIILLLLGVILIISLYTYFKYTPNYYSYLESIEKWNSRYSLYYDYWRDWYSWFIFEHDINYQKYKKVERTQVSLKVYNNNVNDKFIYYFIPNDSNYTNAKIELLWNQYLILNIDWLYHFLYDIKNDIKYDFKKLNRDEAHNKIMKIIKNKSL